MLLRQDGETLIAIPQPSHSWLSGQICRAWGNDRFASPVPRAEVCLAAEQHDLGWLAWELAPGFDAEHGRPQQFMQVPPTTHVNLWREGVRRAGVYSRYAALLVSLHADTIYARHFSFDHASPEDAEAVRDFLGEQHAFQRHTMAVLSKNAAYAPLATPEAAERNRLLIAALDWMSLQLCWGVAEARTTAEVPVAADERTELRLRPGATPGRVVVEPWPFSTPEIEVRAEGRRIASRFLGEAAMRQALDDAEPVVVSTTLVRA